MLLVGVHASPAVVVVCAVGSLNPRSVRPSEPCHSLSRGGSHMSACRQPASPFDRRKAPVSTLGISRHIRIRAPRIRPAGHTARPARALDPSDRPIPRTLQRPGAGASPRPMGHRTEVRPSGPRARSRPTRPTVDPICGRGSGSPLEPTWLGPSPDLSALQRVEPGQCRGVVRPDLRRAQRPCMDDERSDIAIECVGRSRASEHTDVDGHR